MTITLTITRTSFVSVRSKAVWYLGRQSNDPRILISQEVLTWRCSPRFQKTPPCMSYCSQHTRRQPLVEKVDPKTNMIELILWTVYIHRYIVAQWRNRREAELRDKFITAQTSADQIQPTSGRKVFRAKKKGAINWRQGSRCCQTFGTACHMPYPFKVHGL
jgi:hypothetical protein